MIRYSEMISANLCNKLSLSICTVAILSGFNWSSNWKCCCIFSFEAKRTEWSHPQSLAMKGCFVFFCPPSELHEDLYVAWWPKGEKSSDICQSPCSPSCDPAMTQNIWPELLYHNRHHTLVIWFQTIMKLMMEIYDNILIFVFSCTQKSKCRIMHNMVKITQIFAELEVLQIISPSFENIT